MGMITAEEQLALRNKAKAELQRLETVDADLANRFKAKFGVCEIVYKVIPAGSTRIQTVLQSNDSKCLLCQSGLIRVPPYR